MQRLGATVVLLAITAVRPVALAPEECCSPTSPGGQGSAGWRVDANPIVVIDQTHDPAKGEFTRIMGLARLSDGRIVVADGGSSELRYFDSLGRFLASAAGRGSGPGEVNGFDGAHVVHDTVYAYDERGAAKVFDGRGRFVREVPIRNIGPRQLIGVPAASSKEAGSSASSTG